MYMSLFVSCTDRGLMFLNGHYNSHRPFWPSQNHQDPWWERGTPEVAKCSNSSHWSSALPKRSRGSACRISLTSGACSISLFRGMITERLFHDTRLCLKWSDTYLTVHDTVFDLLLKVDPRILHDRARQRYSIEADVGAFEAAKEEPGNAKYIGDRCKVMIESKTIIDNS